MPSDDTERTAKLRRLPALPLRDIVVFPHMVVPLFVGRERSIAAVERALAGDRTFLLTAQKQARVNTPGEEDLFAVGTISHIVQPLRLPDGTVKVLVEGESRGRIVRFVESDSLFVCDVERLADEVSESVELEALIRNVLATFDRYGKINRRVSREMLDSVTAITEPGRLSDTITAHLGLKMADRQALLELVRPPERLRRLLDLMRAEIEKLLLERKVRSKMRQKLEDKRKERLLGEQMHNVRQEVGERDEFANELRELEEKIRAKQMPREAKARARRELRKLKMMPPMSAEATVVRNYIDWILALPWLHYSKERFDLGEAERILDEDHYGLRKAKERILEYLAVQSLVKQMKSPILCFVGPPGVGKTSLACSIGRATSRKYVRQSLGGVRDEAEIRGHRRTYIGAMPGKILQSVRRAGTSNPVFLLDEVDKMSTDFRGDPSSALLEVLDPEQNGAFNDHYLDLDYDLSRVLFITTANNLHAIPPPLQDRMEIIELPGYTDFEKQHIARDHLVPKQRSAHGLREENVSFADPALQLLVNRYTREAGVRNLEREIASICRKIAKDVVSRGKDGADLKVRVTQSRVARYLGPPRFRHGRREERDEIGLANGLAVTPTGGELLSIEVSVMPGRGKLIITGKLGDVMQESAQAAMSYVRSRAHLLGLVRGFYQKIDIHIHVPEGAIPKDGPSAGISMTASLTSALIQVPVRSDVAMTGEITLRGRVLPVGGVKEKVLAAHRGGIETVLIPKENEKDLRDIPRVVRQAVGIELVEHVDEVLRRVLRLKLPPEDFLAERDGFPAVGDHVGILIDTAGQLEPPTGPNAMLPEDIDSYEPKGDDAPPPYTESPPPAGHAAPEQPRPRGAFLDPPDRARPSVRKVER